VPVHGASLLVPDSHPGPGPMLAHRPGLTCNPDSSTSLRVVNQLVPPAFRRRPRNTPPGELFPGPPTCRSAGRVYLVSRHVLCRLPLGHHATDASRPGQAPPPAGLLPSTERSGTAVTLPLTDLDRVIHVVDVDIHGLLPGKNLRQILQPDTGRGRITKSRTRELLKLRR